MQDRRGFNYLSPFGNLKDIPSSVLSLTPTNLKPCTAVSFSMTSVTRCSGAEAPEVRPIFDLPSKESKQRSSIVSIR